MLLIGWTLLLKKYYNYTYMLNQLKIVDDKKTKLLTTSDNSKTQGFKTCLKKYLHTTD